MTQAPAQHGRTAIARTAIVIWLAFLLACGTVISRSQFTTDLSAFLPSSPTPAQQLLLEQIRDGFASRLILLGIEGADAPTRALLSKQIARRLRVDPAFATVNNGEPVNRERDRAFLFNHRYVLSPAVTPGRFSVDGLHAAISDGIDLLASPAGMLVRSLLPRDPTGEMVQLLSQIGSGTRPKVFEGAWTSRDGTRALILIHTHASGSDTDAQQRAMATIQQAFDTATFDARASPAVRLIMTGPGVFSVTSREAIRDQVTRLSLIGLTLIATMLLLVYRSVTALALGFIPVASGALAGIATVSLGFGAVHGITLGFGTALMGEAVDYSIYLFVQSEQGNTGQDDWIERFWPTIRLGMLTSIFGFASLLLSGFPGLAQMGLYSIAGLLTAAMVTRFVLPHLLSTNFRVHDVSALGHFLWNVVRRAPALRWAAALVLLASCAVLVEHRAHLWNDKLSSLSPVSQAEMAMDATLRADIGAPDVRYLVVVSGASREAALQSAEQASANLQTLVDQGTLAGFDSPSRYLPSAAKQRARQSSLPIANVLKTRLELAVQGLPLRANVLAPFLADVENARRQPLLQAADLDQTTMAMAVNALLVQQDRRWSALLPLTAPEGGDINADRIRATLNNRGANSTTGTTGIPNTLFVDMKSESDRLYSGYLHEAILLSLGGLAAIIGLFLVTTRSATRMLRIIAPLVSAVITVAAGLALCGQQLTLLHLVGLLLIAAVGSNYALFFDRSYSKHSLDRNASIATIEKTIKLTIPPRTLASMLFANLTTVVGFGVLAFSNISILQAMGVTVAPGVILALLYAAIFAKKTHE